jgi:hypothetical protein
MIYAVSSHKNKANNSIIPVPGLNTAMTVAREVMTRIMYATFGSRRKSTFMDDSP